MTWPIKSSKNGGASARARLAVDRIKATLDSPPLDGIYYSQTRLFTNASTIVAPMNANPLKPKEYVHIGDVLSRIMAGCRRPDNSEINRIQRIWNEFFDDAIVRHASPGTLEKGILTILVDSSIIIQQLRFQARAIIDEINRQMGQGRINEIRFKIRNP